MCSLNFYMLYIQGYILCISIVSEEPPCENLFVGYYIKNGEKGFKNAFLGINSKSSPRGGGSPAPVGRLSANIFVGKKMYLKRDIERKQLFFSGTYIDHNINSIAKKYIRT